MQKPVFVAYNTYNRDNNIIDLKGTIQQKHI